MKKLTQKLKIKFVAFMLTCAMLFTGTAPYFANEMEQSTQRYTIVEDNVTYEIQMVEANGVYTFDVSNDRDKNHQTITIDSNASKLEVESYDYKGKNWIGIERFEKNKRDFDYGKYERDLETAYVNSQAISYGSKTKSLIGDDYWYCYGSEGAKTYMKIGCVAQYRIRTDNLSATKEAKCDDYANNIKKSNSAYLKGMAYAGGSGAVFGIILGLVTANIAFPPSVIVSIVIATVGGGGGITLCVMSLIDSFEYYSNAKDLYTTIRAYGTKL